MGKGGVAVEQAPPLKVEHEWREELGKSVWAPKAVVPRPGKTMRMFTREEVAKHNKQDDLWLIINDQVFDMTRWVLHHPGGYLPLVNMAGRDATDNFTSYHPAYVWKKKLPHFLIGEIVPNERTVSPFVAEYRQMRQKLLEDNMFETRYSYYIPFFAAIVALFAGTIYFTAFCEGIYFHMLGALCLAGFFHQLAFIGHDMGHNGITHNMPLESRLGVVVGNFLTGVSMGWWKWSHNTHHNECNSVENDPDIQYLPLFAVSENLLGSFYSSFHKCVFVLDRLALFLIRNQHILYYPVMAVARFNLYWQSLYFIYTTNVPTVNKTLESVATLGFGIWMTLLLSTLPTWGEVALFLAISHGLAGILHVQITLSHFAMSTYHGHPQTGSDLDSWWMLQTATSMDITPTWWNHWFHGGLHYQVEHHLFPRIPRHNLHLIQPMVMDFCKKHGIKFHTYGFFEANVMLIKSLKAAADKAAAIGEIKSEDINMGERSTAIEEFRKSALFDGMNALG